MAILCPGCGKQYDHTLFSFGKTITCECGQTVCATRPNRGRISPGRRRNAPEPVPETEPAAERAEDPLADEISRAADRVSTMILNPEVDDWEIELQIVLVREIVYQNMPERLELFEMVYGSRFARLRDQFRNN